MSELLARGLQTVSLSEQTEGFQTTYAKRGIKVIIKNLEYLWSSKSSNNLKYRI